LFCRCLIAELQFAIKYIYGDNHANRILYTKDPQPEHRYRQMVVTEQEKFVRYILEGEVVQPDPKFVANSEDAEAYFRSNLDSALAVG
jgi:hypothetical protein